jgi:hypothetical protein
VGVSQKLGRNGRIENSFARPEVVVLPKHPQIVVGPVHDQRSVGKGVEARLNVQISERVDQRTGPVAVDLYQTDFLEVVVQAVSLKVETDTPGPLEPADESVQACGCPDELNV